MSGYSAVFNSSKKSHIIIMAKMIPVFIPRLIPLCQWFRITTPFYCHPSTANKFCPVHIVLSVFPLRISYHNKLMLLKSSRCSIYTFISIVF